MKQYERYNKKVDALALGVLHSRPRDHKNCQSILRIVSFPLSQSNTCIQSERTGSGGPG